jgi:predicted RNA-binding Zn ribbon-like protein
MVSMSTDWSEVLLDLLNTTPVVDGTPTDVLADDAGARTWLRIHGDGRDVGAARRVRDDLQNVVRGERGPAALNRYLDGVRQVPDIGTDGLTWSLDDCADWSARVVLAWGELQHNLPGRLRPCANDECQLFLLDRSRGGTGRWCSMSGCGNRMKARRHYSRASGRPGT